VRAMLQLQLLTGMRPGEVCSMRTCDVDTNGEIWVYRPAKHKTAHHGHAREVRIGPKAQEVLAPFLRADLTAHVFSPAEATAEFRARQAEARKTPRRPWEHRQDLAAASRRQRRRAPGTRYTVRSYRQAIVRACRRAFDAEAAKGGERFLPISTPATSAGQLGQGLAVRAPAPRRRRHDRTAPLAPRRRRRVDHRGSPPAWPPSLRPSSSWIRPHGVSMIPPSS
jgi:hypothetical protein